jgi:uncharacterized SAM-binding protein YcdF (DUF218 family)
VILNLLKDQLRLSSPVWIVAVLAVGAIWLWWRPLSRALRWYLAAAAAGYWFVTSALGASLLVGGLSRGVTRVAAPADARGADTVVVLGGGASTTLVGKELGGSLTETSLIRALEGARVFKLIGARTLVVSGGIPRPDRQLRPESEMLREVVVKAGVPASSVVEDAQATTTRDHVRFVGPILRSRKVQRFVLVTSPMHMRRALAVFRTAGFDPVPSAAPLRSEQVTRPPLLMPNEESWWLSDMAAYDYAALAYYWWKGWIE